MFLQVHVRLMLTRAILPLGNCYNSVCTAIHHLASSKPLLKGWTSLKATSSSPFLSQWPLTLQLFEHRSLGDVRTLQTEGHHLQRLINVWAFWEISNKYFLLAQYCNTASVQKGKKLIGNRSKKFSSYIRKSQEQLAEGRECKRKNKTEIQVLKCHIIKRKVNPTTIEKNNLDLEILFGIQWLPHRPSHKKRTVYREKFISFTSWNNTASLSQN